MLWHLQSLLSTSHNTQSLPTTIKLENVDVVDAVAKILTNPLILLAVGNSSLWIQESPCWMVWWVKVNAWCSVGVFASTRYGLRRGDGFHFHVAFVGCCSLVFFLTLQNELICHCYHWVDLELFLAVYVAGQILSLYRVFVFLARCFLSWYYQIGWKSPGAEIHWENPVKIFYWWSSSRTLQIKVPLVTNESREIAFFQITNV